MALSQPYPLTPNPHTRESLREGIIIMRVQLPFIDGFKEMQIATDLFEDARPTLCNSPSPGVLRHEAFGVLEKSYKVLVKWAAQEVILSTPEGSRFYDAVHHLLKDAEGSPRLSRIRKAFKDGPPARPFPYTEWPEKFNIPESASAALAKYPTAGPLTIYSTEEERLAVAELETYPEEEEPRKIPSSDFPPDHPMFYTPLPAPGSSVAAYRERHNVDKKLAEYWGKKQRLNPSASFPVGGKPTASTSSRTAGTAAAAFGPATSARPKRSTYVKVIHTYFPVHLLLTSRFLAKAPQRSQIHGGAKRGTKSNPISIGSDNDNDE
ncbi:hypothetical protein NMY22_g265 [Coprinellus aureogranulatus]|nr:hypothetical protein NMY22_g265 [Coprinellus aureogranulatus]